VYGRGRSRSFLPRHQVDELVEEVVGVGRARRRRVAAANDGEVPAYATAAGGAATEVEVEESKPRRRLTAPDDPNQGVSQKEFDEMIRDLHAAPGRTATVEPEEEPPPPPPAKDDARDLLPEDLVLKDSPQRKPKRPRNKRHGRR
jgi:hypothetical protein